MEVFIGWSQPPGRKFAEALKYWLPEVIQQVQPWMSTEDIQKGQRWHEELMRRLETVNEGIICITPGNQHEPWLNFEAGALAKASSGSVRPILLGLEPADLVGPIKSFQLSKATDIEDMKRLVRSLNNGCSAPLDESRLMRAFNRSWDEFRARLESIDNGEGEPTRQRSLEDMISEVVQITRGLEREMLTLLERGILTIPQPRPKEPQQAGDHRMGFSNVIWVRSSRHNVAGVGPEVAVLPSGYIAIRDAKDVTKLAHMFTADEWSQFIEGVKAGEYDFVNKSS